MTQARVLRGARVQLICGFRHTKDWPDLSADGNAIMPQVSSPRVRNVGANSYERLSPHVSLSKDRRETLAFLTVGKLSARTAN